METRDERRECGRRAQSMGSPRSFRSSRHGETRNPSPCGASLTDSCRSSGPFSPCPPSPHAGWRSSSPAGTPCSHAVGHDEGPAAKDRIGRKRVLVLVLVLVLVVLVDRPAGLVDLVLLGRLVVAQGLDFFDGALFGAVHRIDDAKMPSWLGLLHLREEASHFGFGSFLTWISSIGRTFKLATLPCRPPGQ